MLKRRRYFFFPSLSSLSFNFSSHCSWFQDLFFFKVVILCDGWIYVVHQRSLHSMKGICEQQNEGEKKKKTLERGETNQTKQRIFFWPEVEFTHSDLSRATWNSNIHYTHHKWWAFPFFNLLSLHLDCHFIFCNITVVKLRKWFPIGVDFSFDSWSLQYIFQFSSDMRETKTN